MLSTYQNGLIQFYAAVSALSVAPLLLILLILGSKMLAVPLSFQCLVFSVQIINRLDVNIKRNTENWSLQRRRTDEWRHSW